MAGCELVLHVASPMAWIATPPAAQLDGIVEETCWTDADEPGLSAYRRSKVLAERLAWETVAEAGTLELTTILPAAVFGPARSPSSIGPLGIIASLLDGSALALPRLGFEVVDVRDIAAVHLLAMTAPEAAGERFIASGQLIWFAEIADVLRGHLGEHALRVPTSTLTDDEFRAFAEASADLRTLLPLGRGLQHSSAKAQRVLGWEARPVVDTIVDSARSLLAGTRRAERHHSPTSRVPNSAHDHRQDHRVTREGPRRAAREFPSPRERR